jgi:hypothetical protein
MNNWNDLRPDEQAWKERKARADATLKAVRFGLRELVGSHTCRYREEAELNLFERQIEGQDVPPVYPDHPTCLLCGNFEDMEAYCHPSPNKVCTFRFVEDPDNELYTYQDIFNYWPQDSLIPEAIREGSCIYCDEPFERSR